MSDKPKNTKCNKNFDHNKAPFSAFASVMSFGLSFLFALDNIFTPLSSSSNSELDDTTIDTLSSYSPSLLENNVPIRSKSEMSHRIPSSVNQEWHGGIPKNLHETFELSIQKSKSSENVFINNTTENTKIIENDDKLTKSLNDYRLKVAKEDYLRQEIINELLSDKKYKNKKLPKNELMMTERRIATNKSSAKHKIDELDQDDFIIPELPSGQILFLRILSTWGDKYYVGLNGIEIYGDNGELIPVKKVNKESENK